ncbi:MAG: UDP-N-acetylglucosamine 1-carboxyvinyltransferase [Melioribacteraceae bacterium]|nr:UDP-N-acetylglucosamine 1-carboxyvinyltransferase [Melioribacteraceae bacterium]MCF8266314.1 UDP-N-acetylglucosamine 1-carboxyvinyltransferase [Melioribacteraceae bacterium]
MDKFVIRGGKKLSGRVTVSGAKNSVLALMPATLLNNGRNIINNVPEVADTYTMLKLLNFLGVEFNFENHRLTVDTSTITHQEAPYEHVKKMRASVYVLGPLLARYKSAKVSLPGGCAWGPRPINLHLEALKKLNAEIELEEGYILAKCKELIGAKIHFDISSVGATGNTIMAATLAKGTTLITNAATEPEIVELEKSLVKMGARIDGIGTSTVEIEGVDELLPIEMNNIPDRIEAGTLMISAAMTKGRITLEKVEPSHLETIIYKLEDSGVKCNVHNDLIDIDATEIDVLPVDISTSTYPGFPTDMQAQWTAYMTLARGTSRITDNIYFDRFKHIPELTRLGAQIEVMRNSAVVTGGKSLKGAKVMSTDLRASACLVLAGLAAEGETEVLRIYHLDRGYQRIEEKLQKLGADIERVKTQEY